MIAHELNLCKALSRYLSLQYPGLIYRFDFGSGLKLTMRQAIIQKSLNTTRGFPDLFIYKSNSNYAGLAIEIKKEDIKLFKKNGGYVSDHTMEQAEMLKALREEGYQAVFGVGFEACKKIIDIYLKS